MSNTNLDNLPDEIDEKKLIRMVSRIYRIERENSKTDNKTDKKMREEIESIIEEEAKKCY